MYKKYLWLLLAVVTAILFSHPQLLAQVADSTSNEAGNPLDWGKAELLKWAIPIIGSFLMRQWNKVDGWLHNWANPAKFAFYIVIVTAGMELGEFLHMTVSKDTADWGGAFWEGIAGGLLGNLLVALGIDTNKEKVAANTVRRSA